MGKPQAYNWLKQNAVLVVGILLPVLLVAVFLVVQHLPRILVEPPRHDLLLAVYYHDYGHPPEVLPSFELRDGDVYATLVKPDSEDRYRYRGGLLCRYDVSTGEIRRIEVNRPSEFPDDADRTSFAVEAVADWTLDTNSVSPDGYKFEHRPRYRDTGLVGELFGGGRVRNLYALVKNGALYPLPERIDNGRPRPLADVDFFGWVIEPEQDTRP